MLEQIYYALGIVYFFVMTLFFVILIFFVLKVQHTISEASEKAKRAANRFAEMRQMEMAGFVASAVVGQVGKTITSAWKRRRAI